MNVGHGITCDVRVGEGKRSMASHAQGTARHMEGEENCIDGPLSDVGTEVIILSPLCRLLCCILDLVSNYIDCELCHPALNCHFLGSD